MFNSMLTENTKVWFDDIPKESIDSYDDLKESILKNYLQQKKCIKDPVEIHNIKQRDGESIEEFMPRYKLECRDVKGAPECMKISIFMHGITNPELIKRLHDKIPKSVEEMVKVTTTLLRGEVVTSNRERKKSFPSWKQQDAGQKQNFKKGGFQSQQRPERKQDIFTLLTKTPKEILDLDKGKFKPPPAMTTPRQIEEMLKVGKLSHLIKELKQSSGKDQAKPAKKGEEDMTEGSMIIEAVMRGHSVRRMYVDGGSSLEILYEHCIIRLRPEVRSQMIPATTSLVGFSREIIWPLGQISLLVKIGDEEHSTSAWMNFMIVRSPSPYNVIIGRPGVRRIQAVPSTSHKMLKFLVAGGIVTLRSIRIIPLECTMVSEPGVPQPVINQATKDRIQVSIHPEYLEQTIAIGFTLTEKGQKELCGLLRCNLDIFAWKPANMTGVPRHIAEHRIIFVKDVYPLGKRKEGKHLREVKQPTKK
uniref:Reverse transcriptase domain-containing protein n=1 Tax=Tanacetum cinerariifolium TaxID=118510 RepID=A0A6L2J9D0_TANCI|nr:reverse transcriptase domain-containing protein [Tanacetum cinerariifolium]